MMKSLVIVLSKTQDSNQGPLDLQSDTLSTELSGLGKISSQSLKI